MLKGLLPDSAIYGTYRRVARAGKPKRKRGKHSKGYRRYQARQKGYMF